MTSYSPESECSLIERARTILEAATKLQQKLDSASLPQPTFLTGGRYDWYDASHLPDLLETRLNLLEAAQSIFDLVMGPFDTLLYHSSIMRTKLDVLRTLIELKVAEHVPMEGDAEIRELSNNLGLDEGLLNRVLKCRYLMGIFRETKDGFVGHTSFSAALPKVSVYLEVAFSPASGQVAERVLSDDVANVPIYKEWSGRVSDIGMYMLIGAKERSRKEWEELLKKADGRLKIETFKRPASTACAFMQIGLHTVEDDSANNIG